MGQFVYSHAFVFMPANGKSPSSVTEYTWPWAVDESHSIAIRNSNIRLILFILSIHRSMQSIRRRRCHHRRRRRRFRFMFRSFHSFHPSIHPLNRPFIKPHANIWKFNLVYEQKLQWEHHKWIREGEGERDERARFSNTHKYSPTDAAPFFLYNLLNTKQNYTQNT